MTDATCGGCDAPLPTPPPGRRGPSKWCSTRCANRAAQRRRRARVPRDPLVPVEKRCGWCDRSYSTTRYNGRYCSNSCARWDDPRARLTCGLNWRHCDTCDLWWCHSSSCPQSDTHPAKAPPDMSSRPCHSCGLPFVPLRPAGYFALYCSAECRTRETRARRRASGGEAKPYRGDRVIGRVRRWAIYERDGWRCQLCKRKVNADLRVPHPMAATLDHIVPVSLGGDHSEANLQLAHLACNSRKRNKVNGTGEQLRLAV